MITNELILLRPHFLESIWSVGENPLPGTFPGVSSKPSSHSYPDGGDGYLGSFQDRDLTLFPAGDKVPIFFRFGAAIVVKVAPL